MTRVKILKHKELGLLERDINEFIINLENESYTHGGNDYNINNVQLLSDSSVPQYIAVIIYSHKESFR